MRFIFQSLLLLLVNTQSTLGFKNFKSMKINKMTNGSSIDDRTDNDTHNVLSKEQVQTFEKDGVILVRQLISGKELEGAIDAASAIGERSGRGGSYKNIEFQTWSTNDALKDVAFFSKVPKVND
jgi:hypothetical protein